ncbi:MAG: hypothetical protein ACTSPB_04815 [Candidatus Thorarchaeota archaeon]
MKTTTEIKLSKNMIQGLCDANEQCCRSVGFPTSGNLYICSRDTVEDYGGDPNNGDYRNPSDFVPLQIKHTTARALIFRGLATMHTDPTTGAELSISLTTAGREWLANNA